MYLLGIYTISNPLLLKILPWVLEVFILRTALCFGVGRRGTDLRPKAEVTSGEATRKKFSRASLERLDRGRKVRIESLWYPGYQNTLLGNKYCWFALDVTAAMLLVKNKSISLLWELNSIFM